MDPVPSFLGRTSVRSGARSSCWQISAAPVHELVLPSPELVGLQLVRRPSDRASEEAESKERAQVRFNPNVGRGNDSRARSGLSCPRARRGAQV